MNKICLLAASPFSKRDYERFGIFEIVQLGYEILVLDCTPFLYRKFDKKVNGEILCIKKNNVIRCYSIFDLIKNILAFKPDWCFDFLEGYCRKNYFERVMTRIFLKSVSKIVLYRLGSLPDSSDFKKKTIISKIKNKLKRIIIGILSLPWQILNADKVVIGGYEEFKKIKNKQKVIFAHNLDYDNYIKTSRKKFLNYKDKSLLFLDEDFPCHSDYERMGLRPNVNEKSYFKEMSNCLNVIGDKFKLKPYIKLHPRANFEKSKIYYDVQIKSGNTADLIQQSDLIIAHCSTAIQLAVLLYKPLILIKPNELSENSLWYLNIDRFCSLLDIKSFKSQEINNLKIFPKVNREKYDSYIEKFIKINSSKNNFSWEIILENLFS